MTTDPYLFHDKSTTKLKRVWQRLINRGPLYIWDLNREYGLAGTFRFIGNNLRYILAMRYDRAFDRKHGMDTSGEIAPADLDVQGANAAHGNQFMSISEKSFAEVLRFIPDVEGVTFIDVGSGKGRALLLAARQPFKAVLGIEHSAALVRIADENLKSYKGPLTCRDIKSVCADATTVDLPEGPLVIYFFNPFGLPVFEKVMQNIASASAKSPRRIYIVYVSGKEGVLDGVTSTVLKHPQFAEVRANELRAYLDAPWRLSLKVFRNL